MTSASENLSLEQQVALLFRLTDQVRKDAASQYPAASEADLEGLFAQLPDVIAILTPRLRSPNGSSSQSPSLPPLAAGTRETSDSLAPSPLISVVSPPLSHIGVVSPIPSPARSRMLSIQAKVRPSMALPSVANLLAGSPSHVTLMSPSSTATASHCQPSRSASLDEAANLRRHPCRLDSTPRPPALDFGGPSRSSRRYSRAYPVAPAFHSALISDFGPSAGHSSASHPYYMHPSVEDPATMMTSTCGRPHGPPGRVFRVQASAPPPPGKVWQAWHPGQHGCSLPLPPVPQQQQRRAAPPVGRPLRSVTWSTGSQAGASMPLTTRPEL